jgi:molybdate transport system substrate-binding protein
MLLLAVPGCSSSSQNATIHEIHIAAAADLKFALDDLIAEFKRQHPGIDVTATYGASGNFFAQLSNRAPFDLYLSADMEYPRKLIEQELALKDTVFVYAIGHLVIWVPNGSTLDVGKQGMNALVDPAVKKIAVANPKHAPYGKAAVAALKKLKLYERVEDQLVYGDNVAQAAQFVESGAADIGVIPLSLASAPTMRDKGRYADVPADAYPRMDQGGVVLSWAQDRDAALAFRGFLLSAEGKGVLRRYGFVIPSK